MKKHKSLLILAVLAVSLLFPAAAQASDSLLPHLDDQVVFGGTYTLESGEVLDGSLIVIGGVVNLEPDSTVNGDVVVFGGNVSVEGVLKGNLVAIGGVVSLHDNAEVYGDLIAPATVLQTEEGAQVYGQVITNSEGLGIQIPDVPAVPEIPEPPVIQPENALDRYLDSVRSALRPVISFVWGMVRSFALAAAAVLVLLFLPQQTERVSAVVHEYPASAGGLGLLTVFLAVPIMVVTTVTIILIPATILIALALVLGWFFGVVAVGEEIGRRISEGFGYQWAPPLQTAAGSFLIAFLTSILGTVHWGWMSFLFWVVISGIGLGAVMMTRFGARPYVPAPRASQPSSIVEVPAVQPEIQPVPVEEDAPKAAKPKTRKKKTEDKPAASE